MINHSRNKAHCNINPQLKVINKMPKICFFAKRSISVGEELLYDYGDRSPSSIKAYPWLKS